MMFLKDYKMNMKIFYKNTNHHSRKKYKQNKNYFNFLKNSMKFKTFNKILKKRDYKKIIQKKLIKSYKNKINVFKKILMIKRLIQQN